MKNIIQVVRRFTLKDWGGTESLVLYHSQELSKLGYSVRTFSTSAFENPGIDWIDGVKVYRFPYFYPSVGLSFEEKSQLHRKGGDAISFPMFFEILKSKNIALIHSYTFAHLGGMVRTACKIKKIPYVLSLVGGYYGVPDADRKAMMAPTKGHINYGKLFSLIFRRSRYVVRDASAVICDSLLECNQVRKEFPSIPSFFLPNGVRPERFQGGNPESFREKYNIREENILLNVARIDVQKNQILLVKVLPKILDHFPNTKLVLVGQITNQNYYEQLLKSIKESKLEKNVLIILGLKPASQELIDAYTACDIFVLPSQHDTHPITLFEVWAVGKPVIVSDGGDLSNVVLDNQDGLVFSLSNSEEHLKEKLLYLLSNKRFRDEIGKRGSEKVQSKYDWGVIVKKLEQIYIEAQKRYKEKHK